LTTLNDAIGMLDRTRQALLELIAALDEEALDRKGTVGGWSVKNVLAHLAAWEDWVVQALPQRVATGATPEDFRARAEDEDRFNAEEVAEREELTPGEQLMELERTRAELLSYVRGLDAATVTRRGAWAGWPGTIAEYLVGALGEHEAEHVDALRKAL
jgi:uncharacterized protein (TIGR03083 family)